MFQVVEEISVRHLLPMLSIAALSTAASAQTIDGQGAAQLSHSLAQYVSQAAFDKGIVNVVADGDAYRIDIDFNALGTLVPAESPLKFYVAPYALRVKPQADGTWQVNGDLWPDGWVEAGEKPDLQRTEWKTADGSMTGVYDPELGAFSSATGSYAGIKLMSKDAASEGENSYGAGTVAMTATRSAYGGVDFSSRQTMADYSQTSNVILPDSNTNFSVAMKAASLSVEGAGTGMKTKPFLDLLAFGVANADPEKMKVNQAEMKSLMLAALPGWEHMSGTYALADLSVTSPVGILRAGKVNASVAMDGIRQKAKLSYGFQLSKMEVASLFLPAWASVLIPTDVDVNFSGTNLNLDAPARKVIDTLDLNRDPPIPATVTEEIAA
jgi:hypothetical protein